MCSTSLCSADVNDALLAQRAALVPADTPPEVIDFLANHQAALVLVEGRLSNGAHSDTGTMVAALPSLPRDSATAMDSLRAWQRRYGTSAALLPRDKRAAELWTAALLGQCELFSRSSDFAANDIAIPTASGYAIYKGSVDRFFPDESLSILTPHGKADESDHDWNAFRERVAHAAANIAHSSADQQRQILAGLILSADTLAEKGSPQSDVARTYAWRWRHLLGTRIRLTCDRPDIQAFSSVSAHASFTFNSSIALPLQIDRLLFVDASIESQWASPWPQTVLAGTPLTVTGNIIARNSNPTPLIWCSYSYSGVTLHQYFKAHITVSQAVAAEFDPPILFADDEYTRTDPDYLIRVASGYVTIANRTGETARLELSWTADSPLSITSSDRQLNLAGGKSERLNYTLSLPRELDRRQYEFSMSATDDKGAMFTASGQLWATRPRIKDEPRVAVLGDGGPWLRALRALGITAYPLAAESIADADLHDISAVVISDDAAAPDELAKAAVKKLAGEGAVVVVSLSDASNRWLPWSTRQEQRAAPTQVKFHKPDMGWWHSPNTLVANCFASHDSGLVYTLPPGTSEWEPLILSTGGKGFMYRRPAGKGWYVVVHGGWARALQRYDRRALLGLVNLIAR